jgi:hypothetical protein
MTKLSKLLGKIPEMLSSPVSVFIFIFLFIYLFIFGLLGLVITPLEPSAKSQLIFGNYTNVLSALGAALAAGGASKHTKALKQLHIKHDNLQRSVEDLHTKIDKLDKK